MMKKGDYVICEFGHNDGRRSMQAVVLGIISLSILKKFIDEVHKRVATSSS